MANKTRKRLIHKRKRTRRRKNPRTYGKKHGGGDNMKFFHWWVNTRGEEKPLEAEIDYFKHLVKGCDTDFDEVHIYTVFPEVTMETPVAKSDRILTIQYSGEPVYGETSKFDVNIIPGDEPPRENILTAPFMNIYMWVVKMDPAILTKQRRLVKPQKKFCLFSVSSETNEREEFYHALSAYKKVDSCGTFLNNLGHNCPGNYDSPEYHEFISHYKFMICFENIVVKNYITEKLVIAYTSGTIPIYWGCPNIDEYVNRDAMLCLPPKYTEKDVQHLVAEIRRLDQDPVLYKKKFESIFFKGGTVPEAFNTDALNAKICKIAAKKGKKQHKIAFYSNGLGPQGTEIALFDYAYYNQTLFNNTSIIIHNKNGESNNDTVIEKFKKHFDVFGISEDMNVSEIDSILEEQGCDIIYMILSGAKMDIPTKAKVCIHCVFVCEEEPFGDVYAAISPYVAGETGNPVVPHMINLPSHSRNMRAKLSIPENATVFGRYGGDLGFDIDYVKTIVYDVAKHNPNIYFLFANTPRFCDKLPNIIHLDTIIDLEKKVEFINTCDAMLWAGTKGETFGLAIGEFSSKDKPIFVTEIGFPGYVDILKPQGLGIWYKKDTLKQLLLRFKKEDYAGKDLNGYKEYMPEEVMKKFKEVFLEG